MTKKSRRYISVFLVAAMITTFTPAEVFPVTAEDISYPAAAYMEAAWSGSEVTYTAKTADNCTAVDSTASCQSAARFCYALRRTEKPIRTVRDDYGDT